ncbi:MAG: hypothetical protein MK207_08880 [Saprospiraceae bacterium]|nr:hypothetical protein [Saprospiraceae bacterium]
MKSITLFFFFFVLTNVLFSQELESNKSLVKTLNPEQCPNIKIDIKNNNLDVDIWDAGTIRLQLDITANIPLAVLDQLIKAGRYSLDGGKDGEVYIVTAPNLYKEILVGGKEIEEAINIKVLTPGYFELEGDMLSRDIDETSIAGRSNNAEVVAALIMKMKAITENLTLHVNINSSSNYNGAVDLSKYKLVIDGKEITADQISF